MATPQEISTLHDEFQAAVADLDAKTTDYEAKRTPYLEAKAALVAAIELVDEKDNALEAATQAFEPPAKPEAQ
jgi:hypothetical protein